MAKDPRTELMVSMRLWSSSTDKNMVIHFWWAHQASSCYHTWGWNSYFNGAALVSFPQVERKSLASLDVASSIGIVHHNFNPNIQTGIIVAPPLSLGWKEWEMDQAISCFATNYKWNNYIYHIWQVLEDCEQFVLPCCIGSLNRSGLFSTMMACTDTGIYSIRKEYTSYTR